MERDNNTGKQFSWECIKIGYILESKVKSSEQCSNLLSFLGYIWIFLIILCYKNGEMNYLLKWKQFLFPCNKTSLYNLYYLLKVNIR